MKKFISLLSISCICLLQVAAGKPVEPVILPTPQQITLSQGTYSISKINQYKKIFKKEIIDEGYEIDITPGKIIVYASAESGFIYARQTLRLLQWQYALAGYVPCMVIKDAPRTKWRSFMLDSGRQYQKINTIKKYIDLLVLLKMNRFHWHLTEGLGWRIEIKKYPLLTSVGAYVAKGQEQQGYYSQKDIKEIVAYAKARNITVVPEIDMPGHAEAALNAYPQLSCFNHKPEIPKLGFTQHIFCAGKSTTIEFLKNVVDEVCALFPSEYIHLGGDEAPKGNWDQCPDCQKKIKELGLKNSHGLQMWLSAQMALHLRAKGRKAIFWEDVVHQDGYPLPNNVAIHWWNWRGHKNLGYQQALAKNLEVICGTNYYTYLNFPLTPWRGYKQDRTFDIRDAYENNPSYKKDTNALILGISASLWTDDNVTEAMLDRRALPRLFALAQQMWYTGQPLPFNHFYKNVQTLKPCFKKLGYDFGPGLREEITPDFRWD